MSLITDLLSKLSGIKKYLWIALALFIAGLLLSVWIQKGRIEGLNTEIQRVQVNNMQLMAENRTETTLFLKQKELSGQYLKERDSLSKVLQIKPKTITKFIDRVVKDYDTIPVEVPVYILGKNTWKIADSDTCWKWTGIAKLEKDSLNVIRTLFDYHNKITDVYWSQRAKQFLWFRIGKKKTYHKTMSECGGVNTTEINILKK